jgi:polyisoprenoid-binding protein YceI
MFLKTSIRVLLAGLLLLGLAACGPAAAPAEPAAPAAAATEAPAQEPAAEATEAEPAEAEEATAEEAAEEPATEAGDLSGTRTFVIVPEESRASYIMSEEFFGGALAKYGIGAGTKETVGSTQTIEGQFQLNFDDLASALGENQFTVDLSTLTSDQRLRDSWIRENGPTFNDYPTATFVAERLENAPTEYNEGDEVNFQMAGQLTVRDVPQPATFDVTATLNGDTVTGTATAALKLTDFGIEPPNFANTLTVADDFQVQVEFTAREQ